MSLRLMIRSSVRSPFADPSQVCDLYCLFWPKASADRQGVGNILLSSWHRGFCQRQRNYNAKDLALALSPFRSFPEALTTAYTGHLVNYW